MKKSLTGLLFLLLTAGIMSAQSGFTIKFTTKTPFAVASTTLPAGSYQITLMDPDSGVFECSAESGSPSVMFEADTHEVIPTKTEVTFSKYGDKMILKNISIAGTAGYWIPSSLPEKKSKKGGTKPTSVPVAASKK
jgi:hypothetical protein